MEKSKLFLSYHKTDEMFVHRVNYHLQRQPFLSTFCYGEGKDYDRWTELIEKQLNICDWFILFCSSAFYSFNEDNSHGWLSRTQALETQMFFNKNKENMAKSIIIVCLKDSVFETEPEQIDMSVFNWINSIPQTGKFEINNTKTKKGNFFLPNEMNSDTCARKIVNRIYNQPDNESEYRYRQPDGLPIGYAFAYEKDIIDAYFENGGALCDVKKIEQGCPAEWPTVTKKQNTIHDNPISQDEIGSYRKADHIVLVDARSKYHCPEPDKRCLVDKKSLTFPEAGPRKKLCYDPAETLRVGIVVSGGIAPGINSVIAGIVERHYLYYKRGCEQKNYIPCIIEGNKKCQRFTE